MVVTDDGFRLVGLCIRVQAAQGSLTLTPTEHPSTDVTRTRSSTSDLVVAPNTTVRGNRAKWRHHGMQ